MNPLEKINGPFIGGVVPSSDGGTTDAKTTEVAKAIITNKLDVEETRAFSPNSITTRPSEKDLSSSVDNVVKAISSIGEMDIKSESFKNKVLGLVAFVETRERGELLKALRGRGEGGVTANMAGAFMVLRQEQDWMRQAALQDLTVLKDASTSIMNETFLVPIVQHHAQTSGVSLKDEKFFEGLDPSLQNKLEREGSPIVQILAGGSVSYTKEGESITVNLEFPERKSRELKKTFSGVVGSAILEILGDPSFTDLRVGVDKTGISLSKPINLDIKEKLVTAINEGITKQENMLKPIKDQMQAWKSSKTTITPQVLNDFFNTNEALRGVFSEEIEEIDIKKITEKITLIERGLLLVTVIRKALTSCTAVKVDIPAKVNHTVKTEGVVDTIGFDKNTSIAIKDQSGKIFYG